MAFAPSRIVKRSYVDPGKADTAITYTASSLVVDLDNIAAHLPVPPSCDTDNGNVELIVDDSRLGSDWEPGMLLAGRTDALGPLHEGCRRFMVDATFADHNTTASAGRFDKTGFKKVVSITRRKVLHTASTAIVMETQELKASDTVHPVLDLTLYADGKHAYQHYVKHTNLMSRQEGRLSDFLDLSFNYDRGQNKQLEEIPLFELEGSKKWTSKRKGKNGTSTETETTVSGTATVTCSECFYYFDVIVKLRLDGSFLSPQVWVELTGEAGAHIVVTTELEAQLTYKKVKQLFESSFSSFPIANGALFVRPYLTLAAGLDITINGQMSIDAGARWDARYTQPIGIMGETPKVAASGFSDFRPVFEMDASFDATGKVYLRPVVGFDIYTPLRLAGVSFSVDGNIQAPMRAFTPPDSIASQAVSTLSGKDITMEQCMLAGSLSAYVDPYVKAKGWIGWGSAETNKIYFSRKLAFENHGTTVCVLEKEADKDTVPIPNDAMPPNYQPPACTTLIPDAVSVDVSIQNNMAFPVMFYYIDETCNLKAYGTVDAKQTVVQQSYPGHAWVAFNPNTEFLDVFVIPARSVGSTTWPVDGTNDVDLGVPAASPSPIGEAAPSPSALPPTTTIQGTAPEGSPTSAPVVEPAQPALPSGLPPVDEPVVTNI
ncbi:hypothetical protein HDU85_007264 [Gaertneriomyces sp. JEL0708]|nr:hypothetical protein HDU85_007264 [Gaertneriomyces sp. JEL0708]